MLRIINNRVLSKLATAKRFLGEAAHRTAAYIEIREDSSTASTSKSSGVVEFGKNSNNWCRRHPLFSTKSFFSFCAFLFIFGNTFALPDDRSQPLNIQAQKWNYNYKTETAHFFGAVVMTQGSMQLKADTVITQNNLHHKIASLIAYGNKTLAHYSVMLTKNQLPVHASAQIIKYYPEEKLIILEKNAVLIQGTNSFNGDIIHYNIAEQTITIPPDSHGKALLVYYPKQTT